VRGGKPEEGQARIDALLRGGNSAEAQYLLGSAAFQGRDFPRAVEHLGQALTLRPDLPALRSYYGRALLFTGDAEGAEAALREAVVSDRNDYDASYHLASILATRGRTEEARPFAERAAELRPQSAEARALVERLDHPVAAAPDSSPLVGKPAPEVVLRRAGGEPVPLSSFRGRPLVLVLGSLTCPQLRHGIPYVNRLYERYRGRAEFVMAYIREAHPEGGSWSSTINEREGVSLPEARTEAERVEHAALCRSRLDIPFEVMIDALDGAAEAAWGAFPSRAFVIDAAGTVTFSTTLDVETFRPEALEAAVAAVVR
jgi:tetratricopeptide (TPR) repeat protein